MRRILFAAPRLIVVLPTYFDPRRRQNFFLAKRRDTLVEGTEAKLPDPSRTSRFAQLGTWQQCQWCVQIVTSRISIVIRLGVPENSLIGAKTSLIDRVTNLVFNPLISRPIFKAELARPRSNRDFCCISRDRGR
jgi:hypothetical protein